jgi:CheY-like chemotaxis protein
MAVQKYDVARPAAAGGGFEVRYWSPYPAPGRVLYVEGMVETCGWSRKSSPADPRSPFIPAMLAGVALDPAREHHPDLIVLDLHLPEMPGEQLLTLLRAEPATRDIPVVVLSADATGHHIDQLRATGVAAYLTKPIAVRDLLRTLDEQLDPTT